MSASVVITLVLFTLVVVNITGNSLVCAIIRKHRDMRTPINYLILNLAMADALYATLIIPMYIFRFNLSHPTGLAGDVLCVMLTNGSFAWVAAIAAICTLLAIAIDRYYAVVYPLGNKWKCSISAVKKIIAGSWVFGLVFNIPLIMINKLRNNFCAGIWPEEWMGKAFGVYSNLVVFGSLFGMFVLYFRVVHTLWFKSAGVRQVNQEQSLAVKARKRFTLMVVIISVIFAICWSANQVPYTMFLYANYKPSVVEIGISNVMVLFNTAVNPFVYALFSQNFRRKMKAMVACGKNNRVGQEQHLKTLNRQSFQPVRDPCQSSN